MKDYMTTEVTEVTRKYFMPGESSGADVGKMWTHAEQAYREANKLHMNDTLPDDALWFEPHDEGIVIAFKVSVEVERGD